MTLEPIQLFQLFSAYFAGIAVLLGLTLTMGMFRIQLLEERIHRAMERTYDFLDKTIGFAYTEWENVLETISKTGPAEQSIFQDRYGDRKLERKVEIYGDNTILTDEDKQDVDKQQEGLERRSSEVDELKKRREGAQRSLHASMVILAGFLSVTGFYLYLTSIPLETVSDVYLRWVIVGGGNIVALLLLLPLGVALAYLYKFVTM